MKLSVDSKISFVAVFIALLVLFISILDHHESRKHNKKSVTPALNIEKKEFQNVYGIFISNYGYGPAVIDSFEIYYDNNKIINSKDIWMEIFKKHFTAPIDFSIQYNYCTSGSVIGISEEKLLWGSKMLELYGNKQILDNSIEKISIKVHFHSIYDENFVTSFN